MNGETNTAYSIEFWRVRFLVAVFTAILVLAMAGEAGAAEQTLTLRGGWNLISLWVQPDDPSVEAVFSDLLPERLERVFGFDGNEGTDGAWASFRPGWIRPRHG